MISIVLASRKRPLGLAHMLASLYETSACWSDIRVLVALDPDDAETIETLSGISLPRNTSFWVAPKRYGYEKLHYYVNSLAWMSAESTADENEFVDSQDWLMWFNDDMRMLTKNWDDEIRGHRPAVLWPRANHVEHANIAPIWPRSWYKATNRVSTTMHLDTYLQRLGECLDRHDKIPVEIFHERPDVTGVDEDETYKEGRGRLGPEGMVPGFDSAEMIRNVVHDAEIIRNRGLL